MEGRTFSLMVMTFENGCMVSISEGEFRLGSLTVSLYNRSVPVTAEVIPSRTEALFSRLTAERLATRLDGIAILTVSIQQSISNDAAKEIMQTIDAMIQ